MTVARALLLALLAALLAAPAAEAGRYTVHSCRTPDGSLVATDGWVPTGGFEQADLCLNPFPEFPDDRYLSVFGGSNSGAKAGTVGQFVWTAPEGTTIAAYTLFRSTQVSTASQNGSSWATALLEGDRQLDFGRFTDLCEGRRGCSGRGRIRVPFDPGNRVTGPTTGGGAPTRFLSVVAACNNADCPAAPAQANQQVYRADFELDDPSAPAFVGAPSGSLLATDKPLTGVQSVSFAARDGIGAGVEKGILEVDGARVAEAPATADPACRRPFTRRVPCAVEGGATLSTDLSGLADGTHRVRVLAVDAAGNETASEPVTITTRSAAVNCLANQSGAPRITARLANRRTTQAVSFGRGSRIRGRAVDGAGRPLANAPLRLVVRTDQLGAPTGAVDGPTTDGAGRFSIPLGAGTSRVLRVALRSGAEAGLRCSSRLTLRVRARASLRVSPRRVRPGGRVRLRGALAGGGVPARGKLIDLQARERGRWRTFGTIRARPPGRFATSYRFSRRARRASYPIRVRVRAEASYPYALGYSRSVAVRVR